MNQLTDRIPPSSAMSSSFTHTGSASAPDAISLAGASSGLLDRRRAPRRRECRPRGPRIQTRWSKPGSGRLLRPNEVHRHGRRLHQRVVDRAVLDHPGERLAAGFGKTGSRHRDPDLAHPRRTVLAEVVAALDDQSGRIEIMPPQVPLRIEPDARRQPRYEQLRGVGPRSSPPSAAGWSIVTSCPRTAAVSRSPCRYRTTMFAIVLTTLR